MSDRIVKDLKDVALDIVKKENLAWVDVERIEFCKRDKKSKSFADIRKINFPASLYTNKTYVISTYSDFETLNDKNKSIVIWHELLHIDKDDPDKLKKHDIEEFMPIFEKFGDWQKIEK